MVSERILLIVNQASGLGRGRELEEWFRMMGKRVHNKGIDVVCSGCDRYNSIENLAKEAEEKGYSRVILAGGDGTVNKGVNGLAMGESLRKIPIGIIPLGTCNDFARGNGIPQNNIEKAFWTAVYGKEVLVDLGTVNREFFINIVSFGFAAQIVRMIPGLGREFNLLSKKWLYFSAFLRKLVSPLDFPEVMINGQRERILDLVIANGPECGGIFKIAPEASFTDGLLHVCQIGKIDKLRLVELLCRALGGAHDLLPEVKMSAVSSLVVSSFEGLACEVDGEVFDSEKEYIITVHPKSLRLIVPQKRRIRVANGLQIPCFSG